MLAHDRELRGIFICLLYVIVTSVTVLLINHEYWYPVAMTAGCTAVSWVLLSAVRWRQRGMSGTVSPVGVRGLLGLAVRYTELTEKQPTGFEVKGNRTALKRYFGTVVSADCTDRRVQRIERRAGHLPERLQQDCASDLICHHRDTLPLAHSILWQHSLPCEAVWRPLLPVSPACSS
jgi:hypothetical protein